MYLMVGGLALLAAFGEGGKVTGEEGVFKTIAAQPFGRFLLIAAGIGLACYALWRLASAVFNLEGKRGAGGAAERIGGLISALMHGSLAFTALQLAGGERAHGHEGKSRVWVDRVLDQPFGNALIAAVGLILVGFAIAQLYFAATGRLREHLAPPPGHRGWMETAGRVGLAARGIVFAIIGVRLVKASLDDSSHHVREIGSALREVAAQPSGATLLAGVAAGLAAYGLYQLVVARYGRVPGS